MKEEKMAKANENIFWTAPLESSSDFTPEDPLALDYIAQQIGLWLFPGLTSRTSRAGYYPMVIYGLKLCEDAIEQYWKSLESVLGHLEGCCGCFKNPKPFPREKYVRPVKVTKLDTSWIKERPST